MDANPPGANHREHELRLSHARDLIHRRILDNGLIFTARRFRAACRDYRLAQEFITPYTPEQNGMIERFFRSLKEECVWQHNFADYAEARTAIASWIRWYNERRPHQALGYLSPHQYGVGVAPIPQTDLG